MDFLDFIPLSVFEVLGMVAGGTGCVALVTQLIKEYKEPTPSSLSFLYMVGWLLIFSFWGLYGIRIRSFAIGVTNSVAALLQLALIVIVLRKQKRCQAEKTQE